MLNDKKSQVSMEFLFLISFVFVFSLGIVIAAGIQLNDFSDNQKIKLVIDFGESVRKEIDLASVVKDGYMRTIELPDKIDGTINYSIEMNSFTLIINTEYYEFDARISETDGELKKGVNIIKRVNNSIKIENV